MGSASYDRMKDIFVKASELPADERAALLDAQCGDDAQLRAEIESLLRHHDEPTSTITSGSMSGPGSGSAGVSGGAGSGSASAPSSGLSSSFSFRPRKPEPMPKQIGNYRIARELGRGGMGLVYLGVREEGRFKKRVALKVVKKGMDTDDVLKRFELERQLLSALNHPNIASLFDGGTTEDGRPYFALEYVEGMPIDTYCDRKKLSIDERLKLFKQVCSAVAYAHRNLVVHRDIKPANIIVTDEGNVKLLDFGIAKLLNPELSLVGGDPTAAEQRVMTPEYASPEQVRGEKITTASDVYSLGVLLYELLTGHRPYRIKERIRSEIERIICEQEPERPSTAISKIEELPDRTGSAGSGGSGSRPSTRTVTPKSVGESRNAKPEHLRRRLAGDIDNIILMAMRKEPARRYTSVEHFAEDIERHMSGLPVSARPASIAYRSSKFVRRNKAGVAIAALLALTTALGIGFAFKSQAAQANFARAETQEARADAAEARKSEAEALAERRAALAERRAMSVRDLARVFLYDFNFAIQQLEGATKARELLVTTALEFLKDIEQDQDAAGDPLLQVELARAYDQVGDVQGGRRNPSLGDVAGAIESFEKALELRLAVAEEFADASEFRRDLIMSYERIGDAYLRAGDIAAQAEAYRKQYEVAAAALRDDPDNVGFRHLAARALIERGSVAVRIGDHQSAKDSYHAALQELEEVQRARPGEIVDRDITRVQLYLAVRYHLECDYETAIEFGVGCLTSRADRMKDVHTQDPTNARVRRDVASANKYLGLIYLDAGEFEKAQACFETDRDYMQHLVHADPNDSRAARDRGEAYINLGELHYRQEQYESALQQYRTATTYLTNEYQWDQNDALVQIALTRAHEGLARTLAGMAGENDADRLAEAMDEFRKAMGITSALREQSPEDAQLREFLARQQAGFAALLLRVGSEGEAWELLAQARDTYNALLQDAPKNCMLHEALRDIENRLAELSANHDMRREARGP